MWEQWMKWIAEQSGNQSWMQGMDNKANPWAQLQEMQRWMMGFWGVSGEENSSHEGQSEKTPGFYEGSSKPGEQQSWNSPLSGNGQTQRARTQQTGPNAQWPGPTGPWMPPFMNRGGRGTMDSNPFSGWPFSMLGSNPLSFFQTPSSPSSSGQGKNQQAKKRKNGG